MDENKKEIRNTIFDVTVSEGEESRKVEGYALLFGSTSDGLPFEEVIERGALDGVIEKSNVFALLNHDPSRGILARSKKGVGTLALSVDEKGLLYSFDAPKTALGDELLEHIKRGNISESSFAFTVGEDKWEKKSDGTWKRTIKRMDNLFDVAPVYDAAYSKTSVYKRGMEEAQKELDEIEAREKQAELDTYYTDLNRIFN